MSGYKTDVPYGTLDLPILKTLDTMGPMHGYRIARRIEQVAENLLRLNQGSIYPALIRLEQHGWIRTEWGISETKRKVKFYSLTRAGTKQLSVEVANWERATALRSGVSAWIPRGMYAGNLAGDVIRRSGLNYFPGPKIGILRLDTGSKVPFGSH